MALAVTVSSKTLEATTLLIQSDLDLIVKSSRDEIVRVRREHAHRQTVAGRAAADLQRAASVSPKATTGADGVFKQSYKELNEAADVRVLGLAAGRRGVEHRLAARRRRGPGPGGQGIYLHRSLDLSAGTIGVCPRRAAPRGGRQLHGRARQEVHARGARSAAAARSGRRR